MSQETDITSRKVIRITGEDTRKFLQGLVTNDVKKLDDGMVYAAMLTPQGKYLADFFLVPQGEDVLVDVGAAVAPVLMQKFTMFKLRSKVAFEETGLAVTLGTGEMPEGAFADPRHPDLGWRSYGEGPASIWDGYEATRIGLGIPATAVELIPNDTYILEARFDEINGVDFKKGCYVGQEVTARMKHKIEMRKGLRVVDVDGGAPVGTEIIHNGKAAGVLYSQSGGRALAFLRFDRAAPEMQAGDALVKYDASA
ncbi:MAG: YgfZ/GcvT domain-containing protein [Mangrovicoccus sp.]